MQQYLSGPLELTHAFLDNETEVNLIMPMHISNSQIEARACRHFDLPREGIM